MRLFLALALALPLACLPELEPGEALLEVDCNVMPCGEDTSTNREPGPPSVEVMPASVLPGEQLYCLLTHLGEDPEGGKTTHTYGWKLNGMDLDLKGRSITVEGDYGDSYSCWAKATDNMGTEGTAGESEEAIVQLHWGQDEEIAPPMELSIIQIDTPDLSALLCVFQAPSSDNSPASPVSYSYEWAWSEVDTEIWNDTDVSIPYLSGNILIEYNDDWLCTITSHQDGMTGSSESIERTDLEWQN